MIGRNFCGYLIDNNYSFTVFARASSDLGFLENKKNVVIYRYEKSIAELIGKASEIKNAVFVNLAWAEVDPEKRNDPMQMTFNIPEVIASVELSKKIGVKHWIGFGSQAEYGNINIDHRVDEHFPCNPVTLYGKAKLFCAGISAELCKAYGMEHSWLRLFSAYGPHGNHQWLIDYLIEEMKSDKVVNVTKCEQYLDYIYVDDISRLLVALGGGHGAGIANLGFGKAVQLKTIIETIRTLTKSKSTVNYGAFPYRPDQSMFQEADISKLEKLTGWKPEVTIEQGLSDMIAKSK